MATVRRLHNGQSVKLLVAMPPYDLLVPDLLRVEFPEAKFEVTTWPVEGKSLVNLRQWAERIRGMTPDLVVVAVPSSVTDKDTEAIIRNHEWVLNWSFHFSRREWDVVPICQSVTGPLRDQEGDWLGLVLRCT